MSSPTIERAGDAFSNCIPRTGSTRSLQRINQIVNKTNGELGDATQGGDRMLTLTLTASLLSVATGLVAQAPEGLPNPGFEERSEGGPAGWHTRNWQQSGVFTHVQEGRGGG